MYRGKDHTLTEEKLSKKRLNWLNKPPYFLKVAKLSRRTKKIN